MKLRDHVKQPGHYKPSYRLVEKQVQNAVLYDAEEHKDKIIE